MRTGNLSASFLIPNNIPAQRYLLGAKDYAGFENRNDSTIGITAATSASAAFVISGNYNFWIEGAKYTKTTSLSTIINNDQKLHYVYFDTSGNLSASLTPWNITDGAAPIALVYKDLSGYALQEERHGHNRDRDWHKWAHTTIGARYGSGFTCSFSNTALTAEQGVVLDEDIPNDSLTTRNNCTLWYRNSNSSAMRIEPGSTTPYKAIAGVLQYDSGTGLSGVTNNNYMCTYEYATNDKNYPIYVVLGQAQYTTVANARNDSLPTLLLSTAEWKLIYRTIYRNVNSVPTFIESADYRNVSSGPAGTSVINDHQSLINRSADNAHPQSSITGLTSGDIATFAGVNVLGSTIPANGIYRPNTNSLGFSTNSTSRMEIDSNGSINLGNKHITAQATCPSVVFGDGDSGVNSTYGNFVEIGRSSGQAFIRSFKAGAGDATLKIGRFSDLAGITIDSSGNVIIGTGGLFVSTSKTVTTPTTTGTTGQIAWDANYIYICVGTNEWKRAAISTWTP